MQKLDGGVTAAQGFQAAGVHCGIKRKSLDLALLASTAPAVAAGVFTSNAVQAAPIKITKEHLSSGGSVRAVIVNSGNANASTGKRGVADARAMAALAAQELGCEAREVLAASTGLIGVKLPMEKISAGIKAIVLKLDPAGHAQAARAILTTDTFSKEYALQFALNGKQVRLGGMAKGSGMIHPDLATMLAFITTDIRIKQPLLDAALRQAADASFNMISVDGDTSTNDMALVLANGMAGNPEITADGEDYRIFCEALNAVTRELAKQIAKDGEGATKLVEINVTGASDLAAARSVARSIAGSNLVKTAIFGEDANWGRILCAAGYSGTRFDVEKVQLYLGGLQVAAAGEGLNFDESEAQKILARSQVSITLDLGAGEHQATAWTCDLTYDYIKINAGYRS